MLGWLMSAPRVMRSLTSWRRPRTAALWRGESVGGVGGEGREGGVGEVEKNEKSDENEDENARG